MIAPFGASELVPLADNQKPIMVPQARARVGSGVLPVRQIMSNLYDVDW